ncbi:pyridoxamine 5'-phosphate oxidase family protein [Nocardia sp. BMG51109]|uniref:pyridoxamine 5'-phosphate oxidase family protein n=1 Tax=Nocardia sp. BMG51109 TaxID=1056816 RepID=UPI000463B08D|nr:pyridoxamine 5'-phosphate oxidase family protein [Nocardia sp. BMG51109]
MRTEAVNLDGYGNAPLPWARARQALEGFAAGPDNSVFLSTCRPDGRPHTTGIGALWLDDGVYIVSGESTRKSRNLATNPFCTVAFALPGLDLVVEGTAALVTATETLERVAHRYREVGWPAEVRDGAFTAPFSAPSAGPPPWRVYFITPHSAVGVASAEPHGATRWSFA